MKNKIVGKRTVEIVGNSVANPRYEAGVLHLFVDGQELKPGPSLKVWNHSPDGFNAGYKGSGPAQSALAILLHVLKDEKRAVQLHQKFKVEFLAKPEYLEHDFEFEVSIIQWAVTKELGFE